jgi:hypothetical protein
MTSIEGERWRAGVAGVGVDAGGMMTGGDATREGGVEVLVGDVASTCAGTGRVKPIGVSEVALAIGEDVHRGSRIGAVPCGNDERRRGRRTGLAA